MKNTNSKEYKDALKAYLLPIIRERAESHGETIEGNPFAWVLNLAKSEVGDMFDWAGRQAGMCHWLQGLGMGLDFENYRIVEVAEGLHGCTLTAKEAEKVNHNWFNHIAAKIIQFSKEA